MSRLVGVLLKPHLGGPGREKEQLEELASKVGIDVERLEAFETGTERPRLSEIGALAEALNVDPIHLFRPSPVVAARRSNRDLSEVCSEFLNELDLHFATYLRGGLQQRLDQAFPARKPWHARAAGEGWAKRTGARGYVPGNPEKDPLIRAVESDLGVPVVIWPIPETPFGATIRLGDIYVIWVNSHDVPETQQRFTLAHEVGHLLLRHVNAGLLMEEARSVDSAVEGSSPINKEIESHAQHFASGVMADRELVLAYWTYEATAAAVAELATQLGTSFEATRVLLDRHLSKEDAAEVRQASEGVFVRAAFQDAGLGDVYETMMAAKSRRYFSPLVPEHTVLELNLERSLG